MFQWIVFRFSFSVSLVLKRSGTYYEIFHVSKSHILIIKTKKKNNIRLEENLVRLYDNFQIQGFWNETPCISSNYVNYNKIFNVLFSYRYMRISYYRDIGFTIAHNLIEDTFLLLTIMTWYTYIAASRRQVFSDRWEVKGKDTIFDGTMCVELMEIVTRVRTCASVVIEFTTGGGRGGGRGGNG